MCYSDLYHNLLKFEFPAAVEPTCDLQSAEVSCLAQLQFLVQIETSKVNLTLIFKCFLCFHCIVSYRRSMRNPSYRMRSKKRSWTTWWSDCNLYWKLFKFDWKQRQCWISHFGRLGLNIRGFAQLGGICNPSIFPCY